MRASAHLRAWSTLPQRIRAGCDGKASPDQLWWILCHSAFARVATLQQGIGALAGMLCHSAFARVATKRMRSTAGQAASLPQRIRAGCDGW